MLPKFPKLPKSLQLILKYEPAVEHDGVTLESGVLGAFLESKHAVH